MSVGLRLHWTLLAILVLTDRSFGVVGLNGGLGRVNGVESVGSPNTLIRRARSHTIGWDLTDRFRPH